MGKSGGLVGGTRMGKRGSTDCSQCRRSRLIVCWGCLWVGGGCCFGYNGDTNFWLGRRRQRSSDRLSLDRLSI